MSVIIAGFHYIGFAVSFYAYIAGLKWFKKALSTDISSALAELKKIQSTLSIGLVVSIFTGFYRLFGGLDKGVAFYMKNPVFHAKLGLIFLIIILEVISFLIMQNWTQKYQEDAAFVLNASGLKKLKIVHMIKVHVYLAIPFLAAAVARGVGLI